MKKEEHLSWIMDYKKDTYSYAEEVPDQSISSREWVERNWKNSEDKIKKNVDFVHSLGLKCDSVGWCSIDLNRPDIDSLLDQINAFALKEGLYLRGGYSRRFSDFDSEWYLLESEYLSNGEWNYVNVTDRSGNPLKIDEVYAFKVPKYIQVLWDSILPHVNENFRKCCLNHELSGVDFYWIRDIGRYHATQFFGLMIENIVPEFACYKHLSYSDSKNTKYKNKDHFAGSPLCQQYQALGGALPKLSQMFYDLEVNLPIQLPKSKMPETDFAYTDCYALIKKRAADILLSERVIREEYLTPVLLYDSDPECYEIKASHAKRYPCEDAVKKLELDYYKLKENPKPERKASEKDALKLFRQIKRIRPVDFNKGLAKKKLETFVTTPYEAISSYYSISEGGYLSDEYHFLSYIESQRETQDYDREIKKEELLPEMHTGIVIAKCTDGDIVIKCDDGSVKRISHETMDVCESWDTVAQFFFESLNDE